MQARGVPRVFEPLRADNGRAAPILVR
jgi:hypothetical protein